MPTAADENLRDFKRFTGDGLPDEPAGAPLPIGDPTSGAHTPTKAELRAALNGATDDIDNFTDNLTVVGVDGVTASASYDDVTNTMTFVLPAGADGGSNGLPSLAGQAGNVIVVNDTEDDLDFDTILDVPTLAGNAGKALVVNPAEDGVDFDTMFDVPDLVGNAGKALAVNNTEDGIDTVDFVNVAAFLNATGDAPSYSVRLWANLNGLDPVAINESGNIATFTRSAAGVYEITFTDDMPVANYAVSFAGSRPSPSVTGQADGNIYINTQTVSALNFTCVDGGSGGSATDLATICITIVC